MAEPVSRRRSSEQVRSLLIEAAAARFAEHDYDHTTIKDITDAVNVSVSVFYRHFQDKADVYEAAVLSPLLSFLTDFVPTWQAHRDEPFDDTAQMHALLKDLYDNISRHRNALRAFVGRGGELDQNLTDRLNLAVGRIFHQIILMGAEESDRRMWRLTAAEVDQTIRLLISMVLGAVVFEPWILPDARPAAREHLVERMVDLALHGTTARQPGHAVSLADDSTADAEPDGRAGGRRQR